MFSGCIGIEVPSDAFDLYCNILCTSTMGALEGHVFKHVSHPIVKVSFISGASINPYTNCGCLNTLAAFTNDAKSIGKSGHLSCHVRKNPLLNCAVNRVYDPVTPPVY